MELLISDKHALSTGQEFVWTTWDGDKFFARAWRTADKPRGVILAIHGLSGAAQDFAPLGNLMAEKGWATFALELRGQGRDPRERRRGDLVEVRDWYQDLDAFYALIQLEYPGVPWFLTGESMGAVLAIYWLQWLTMSKVSKITKPAALNPPSGLMLLSPVVTIDQKITLWQEVLFNGLSRLLPKRRVSLGAFAPSDERDLRVTRDQAYQEYIYVAPHHLHSYSLRFVRHLGQLVRGCSSIALPIDLPVLIPYARNDVFIAPRLIDRYFDNLQVADKSKLLYREAYHCLLHDFDAPVVLADLEKWLERILAQSPANSRKELLT